MIEFLIGLLIGIALGIMLGIFLVKIGIYYEIKERNKK
jgi:ABC-type nitrate/sulfonate/bicarbonate transport system permease component